MDLLQVSKDVCKQILALDKNIRFAGIVDKFGKISAAEYRKGSPPLLSKQELSLAVIQSTMILGARKTFQPRLGKIDYAVASFEKVKLTTIPLDDGCVLLVSFDKEADHEYLIHKRILPLIRKHGLRKN